VSADTDTPQPYQVSLSARVYDKVRELAVVARDRGDGEAFLAALREFYRRLRVYPSFGATWLSVWLGPVAAAHGSSAGIEPHAAAARPAEETGTAGAAFTRVEKRAASLSCPSGQPRGG
jgi:hypothetical protein